MLSGLWTWSCDVQMAKCLWYLEHLPHKVYSQICKELICVIRFYLLWHVNPTYCVIFIYLYVCLVSMFSQGGNKLERARDLFEQVLEGCPAKFAKCKVAYSSDFLLCYVPHMLSHAAKTNKQTNKHTRNLNHACIFHSFLFNVCQARRESWSCSSRHDDIREVYQSRITRRTVWSKSLMALFCLSKLNMSQW